MTVNRVLHIIAGTFIMISVVLGYYMSPWFFIFTFFVGANLFQSGFSNWCLMADILKKFGLRDET
ncbi:YgaP family membrane protein [Pseudoteredinibacter isoporae]|uniref:YgaP family membrane protein n=1 Tax=Pseudoteredinibacter isoporae TaxID=570281 RepID=UPI0031042664